MFRNTLLRTLRTPLVTRQSLRIASVGAVKPSFVRFYSGFPPLDRDLARERILELLEGYEKVDKSKEITEESSFVQDLGLDSLDVVEVVMELEHEFNIQIPDNEADSLKTVGQAIDYVLAQEDSV
ncbi:mitochondrial acyl carrier protein [Scheffersomyces xylosifermentans]|uniref:mitochondrial acyl carrier protein n=1 Tax=Scheffersomyces xylosifermentans TaxID=1304137 RepID=UPI00315CCC4D